MYPTLFMSHGAPNTILGDSYTKDNIVNFSKTLQKPKYIIIFSAHYVTGDLQIIDYDASGLMYDFYGFEKESKYNISVQKTDCWDYEDNYTNGSFNYLVELEIDSLKYIRRKLLFGLQSLQGLKS